MEALHYLFAKTAYKKIWALIPSMKFFSPKVDLHFYKPTIWVCLKYYCHVWVGAPSCYLEMLDKLQKQIYKTFGPSYAACLKHWAHHQKVAWLQDFSFGSTTLFSMDIYLLFWYIAWFSCNRSQMLWGYLSQQFPLYHS